MAKKFLSSLGSEGADIIKLANSCLSPALPRRMVSGCLEVSEENPVDGVDVKKYSSRVYGWRIKKGSFTPALKGYYDTSALISDAQDFLYELFSPIVNITKRSIRLISCKPDDGLGIIGNKIWMGKSRWEIDIPLIDKMGKRRKTSIFVDIPIERGRFKTPTVVEDSVGRKIPLTKEAITHFVENERQYKPSKVKPSLPERDTFPWMRNEWHFDPTSPASGFLSLGSKFSAFVEEGLPEEGYAEASFKLDSEWLYTGAIDQLQDYIDGEILGRLDIDDFDMKIEADTESGGFCQVVFVGRDAEDARDRLLSFVEEIGGSQKVEDVEDVEEVEEAEDVKGGEEDVSEVW